MAKIKLIMGTTAIKAAILSIETRGKKLDNDIQRAACSCIFHAGTKAEGGHGDVTLLNRLVEAMPAGSRVNALKEFIEKFGPVRHDDKAKMFVHVKGKPANTDAAMAKMWTEFKPEPDYKSMDPEKFFDHAVKAMEKDMKELGDASKVTPAMIAGLRLLRADAMIAH
jgi:hypothetical protein